MKLGEEKKKMDSTVTANYQKELFLKLNFIFQSKSMASPMAEHLSKLKIF